MKCNIDNTQRSKQATVSQMESSPFVITLTSSPMAPVAAPVALAIKSARRFSTSSLIMFSRCCSGFMVYPALGGALPPAPLAVAINSKFWTL